MATMTLPAERRTALGRNACRRIRNEGKIPAVVYGADKENIPIAVNKEQIASVLRGSEQLIELTIEGKTENVLIKDTQFDYLGDELLHVDFLRVAMDVEIRVSVQIESRGQPASVEKGDGVLENPLKELEVICLPGNIPSAIVIDISGMELNHTLTVKDLPLPEGVRTEEDPELVVYRLAPPEEEMEEEAVEAPAEPELIRPEGREEEQGESES